MKKLLVILFLSCPFVMNAQSETEAIPASKANLGLGLGLDYGGVGGRLTFLPSQNVGLFGSIGYAIAGVGYNVGACYRISPNNRVVPVFYGMYGYNAALKVTGSLEVNEVYYGPSFGFGLEIKNKNKPVNFWSLELLVPVRDSQFERDMDALESIGVQFTKPLPVTFSIGYHFGL